MESNSISLFELNERIKGSLRTAFPHNYWVTGEISEMRMNRNGHCYLELIEKDERSDQIIAKAKATIWAYSFRILKPYFETTTKRNLSSGIKVLVNVSIDFHELYGFSLNIRDIDPTYTLGDLARKRMEIIARLEQDGVINMNKELPFPVLPLKIAIISSKTAAGYGDFIDQLINNQWKYKFYHKLFPAVMQGDKAESSIVDAIDRIYTHEEFFDVVVIIRGGGSQADLSCFDNYLLALNIAQFPLPFLSGIGHERDETIVDRVAHTSLKTPTAVAEFLISVVNDADMRLNELQELFTDRVKESLSQQKVLLENLQRNLSSSVKSTIRLRESGLKFYKQQLANGGKIFLQAHKSELGRLLSKLQHSSTSSLLKRRLEAETMNTSLRTVTSLFLAGMKHNLEMKEQAADHFDPKNVLKRGYSLTSVNGKIIKNISGVNKGDIIITLLSDGKIKSEVTEKNMQ